MKGINVDTIATNHSCCNEHAYCAQTERFSEHYVRSRIFSNTFSSLQFASANCVKMPLYHAYKPIFCFTTLEYHTNIIIYSSFKNKFLTRQL